MYEVENKNYNCLQDGVFKENVRVVISLFLFSITYRKAGALYNTYNHPFQAH